MKDRWSGIVELGLAILSPPRCAACDASVGIGRAFCPVCAATVLRSTSAGAAFVYGGAMATAITRMKYGDRPELGRVLGALLASTAALEAVDLIAPVPLHPTRLAERGFNQSALLAKPLADSVHARFAPRLLSRVRPTPRQAALDRAERRANVAGAFKVRAPVVGMSILVIDDVRTTGSTLEACERALFAAGAREVRTLVLAEAP